MAISYAVTSATLCPPLGAFVNRVAGFPVRVVWSGFDYFQEGRPTILLVSGKHRTAIHIDPLADFEKQVLKLLEPGIRDLQMQFHGYNDFQRAIGMMANEQNID